MVFHWNRTLFSNHLFMYQRFVTMFNRQENKHTQLWISVALVVLVLFFFGTSLFFLKDALFSALYPKSFRPFSGSSVTGHSLIPVKSNQWYSSVLNAFPTQPLFAFPLAYKVSSSGLSFSYPDVNKTANTVFGSYVEDFTVGSGDTFSAPTVTSIGDYSVGLSMKSSGASLSYTLAHGVPYTVITSTGTKFAVSIPHGFTVYDNNSSTSTTSASFTSGAVMVITKNHSYIFNFQSPVQVAITDKQIVFNGANKVLVGLLDSKDRFDTFKALGTNEVIGTSSTFDIGADSITTHYQFDTRPSDPLITLMPHQADFVQGGLTVLGEYQSIRGPLKLVKAKSFSTTIPLVTPPDSFIKLSSNPADLVQQVKDDIAAVISQGAPGSKDYYLGTWFGKVSNLILLADTLGLEDDKKKLREFAEPIFLNSMSYFTYDKTKTSVIATSPEFGNEKLNDHHFHYGYFLRTAAVLSKFNPGFADKVKSLINDMVGDIANADRQSVKFPYLRNFDPYEGHSWADGYSGFLDGNNQESSSEAINAWYGVYLWSKTIKDSALEKQALYLYNSEIQGTRYYWFDIKNFYAAPYNHAIGVIVWGGKVDFATWFSGEANMKYGIELLPFTPASGYLGKLPDFLKYDKDFAASGGDIGKPWGDLFVMWKSYYSPKEALALKDKVVSFEGNNPKSLFLYTLYANNADGL